MEGFIDKPLEQYERKFSNDVVDISKQVFDLIIKETNTDESANKKTVAKYKKTKKQARRARSIFKIYRYFGVLMSVSTVVLGVLSYFKKEIMFYTIIGAVTTLALAVLFIFCAVKKHATASSVRAEEKALREEAENQMTAMRSAVSGRNIPIEIFNKVFPNIRVEESFSKAKHGFWRQYGIDVGEWSMYSDDRCITGILSGNIGENPFVIIRYRERYMKTAVYSGSLTITWETKEKDEEGNERIVKHEQELKAYVSSEVPAFKEHHAVEFGCQECEKLFFSRRPFGVSQFSNRRVERKIKSRYKSYRKDAQKRLASGNPITLLTNEKFEALFGAINRNDDTHFRFLFTPLAQQNMEETIRSRNYDGDKFEFTKRGYYNLCEGNPYYERCFSSVSKYSTAKAKFSTSERIDLQKMKEEFVTFMTNYVESVYMSIIPFLNIPLYQQSAPKEKYDSFRQTTCSDDSDAYLEQEADANAGEDYLRTFRIYKGGRFHYSGYTAEDMLDYVPVKGDDGKTYDVPVHWKKYNRYER